MAYFRCGGGGMPAGLQSGMDAVLNKKFGTSTTYPASGWPDNVNLLGPLPIIISNKAPIVSFADGANDVPIEQGTFYVVPSQAGTGTPSPSNPRAISGYTGMTITHTDGQTPPVESETIAVSWQTEAGTVYGGELNVTTGVLTATWGEVDLGDLSWTYNASYLAFYATVNDKKNGSNGYIDIYDRTTYWITSQEWADANNVFYCSGGNKYLAIKNTDYSNAATFKTAMEGHKFVFELDTPVTYQLDPHELRTYYGNNNFYCDTGDSQLNYRADISLYINNH